MDRNHASDIENGRHVKDLEAMVLSLKAASSKLATDNARLKRELGRFTTQNEIPCATTNSPIDCRHSSSGPFVPTLLIKTAAPQSLVFPLLEDPPLWARGSWSHAEIDPESSSQSTLQGVSTVLSSANTFSFIDSAAYIEPTVAQDQQQPLQKAASRPCSQPSIMAIIDKASIQQTTKPSPFSPPFKEQLFDFGNVPNKSSLPHSAGPCGVNLAKPLKRKHEYVEHIFDSRSTRDDDGEQQVKRGRRGPLSTDVKERQKNVKNLGGACWRCRILKKPCDDGDECSNCRLVMSTASIWSEIGCRRGSLNIDYEERTDYGKAKLLKLFHKQIDSFRDQIDAILRMKRNSNDERLDATGGVINEVLDSISLATSNSSMESCLKSIERIVNVCNGICKEKSVCRKMISDCCMKFSLVIGNCGSDIWTGEIDVLHLFAFSCFIILDKLSQHLKYHGTIQYKEANSKELEEAYAEFDDHIYGTLCNRLEPFIFRKKRSHSQHFREWLYILYLLGNYEPLRELFIASSKVLLKSSRAGHKTERNAVKELLTHIISDVVFDEDGSTMYRRGLEFVAKVAGLSSFTHGDRKRTIAKSSVLSQMPEESSLVLKAFQYFDRTRMSYLNSR